MGNSFETSSNGTKTVSRSIAELSDGAELSISIKEQNEIKKGGGGGKYKTKVISEIEAHRIIAEKNLKISLTHPTILLFFRAHMRAQGLESMLDYYIAAIEVRNAFKEGGDYLPLLINLVTNYVDKDGKFSILPISDNFRHMIMINYNDESTRIFAIQGIRLTQYEVFYVIKVHVCYVCVYLVFFESTYNSPK